jgi:pimeloyl-ACP methyl ester carboxylesterase
MTMYRTVDQRVDRASPGAGEALGVRVRWRTTDPLGRLRGQLVPLWNDRAVSFGTAAAMAATWGIAAGWWMPRGPLTAAEAVWSIVISVLIGALAGVVTKSRWAMLVAPVAFAALFEIVRLDLAGPSVDAIRLSPYGLLAFATGRGVHALLALVPLAVGAVLGAGAARSLAAADAVPQPKRRRGGLIVRRVFTVMVAASLLAFSLALLRPASTSTIRDTDGDVVPGSIAELTTVEANGHDLGLLIRGHSVDNPVLLFLAGGPGGSEYGAMVRHLPELEEHVTVVTLDQRGAGTSYPELDPTDTLTLDGAVDDTIVVTEYLLDRFDTDQIYVAGQSWGTTLGVLAVQERPELYRAFVGTGQMVSQRATDRIFYDDTLAWAEETGRDGLADELRDIGPPPYDDMLDYETALSHEQQVYAYDHSPNAEGQGQMSENLLVAEYTLLDQLHVLPAFMDTFAALYPQLQEVDFRETATEFEVPMFFVQGAHEADGRADVFDEWFPMIDAPIVDRVELATSGHRPLWEQPDEFVDYMVDTVLASTAPTATTAATTATAAEATPTADATAATPATEESS